MTTPQPEKPRKFMLTIPEDVYAELIYLKLQKGNANGNECHAKSEGVYANLNLLVVI